MPEIIYTYETQLRGRDDHLYAARVMGNQRSDGRWEGWLEFPSLDGASSVVTPRETTQPSLDRLRYWASGLTDPYLDGALLRAQTVLPHAASMDAGIASSAVLDPFHVYAEGEEILRGQLHALSAPQLRGIATQYRLTDRNAEELSATSKPALIALIMAAVDRR